MRRVSSIIRSIAGTLARGSSANHRRRLRRLHSSRGRRFAEVRRRAFFVYANAQSLALGRSTRKRWRIRTNVALGYSNAYITLSRTHYVITHTLRYHAHITLSRTQYVITHTSTLAVKAMFISRGLRVFQSRMTPTSTLSAGMLNETLCRRNRLRRRNCGNTGRCIAGIYLRNLSPEYYHHGQSWPIARLPNWIACVNEVLTAKEFKSLRTNVQRGQPYGDSRWIEETTNKYNLWSTLRPVGQPKKVQEPQ